MLIRRPKARRWTNGQMDKRTFDQEFRGTTELMLLLSLLLVAGCLLLVAVAVAVVAHVP